MPFIKIAVVALSTSSACLAGVLVYALNVPTKPSQLLASPSWITTVEKNPAGPERWAVHKLIASVDRNGRTH